MPRHQLTSRVPQQGQDAVVSGLDFLLPLTNEWGGVARGCNAPVFLLQPALDTQRRKTRVYSDIYLRTPTSPTTGSAWDWKGLTDAHMWGPEVTKGPRSPSENHSWAHLMHLEQTCSWEEMPRVGFKKDPPDLKNRLG